MGERELFDLVVSIGETILQSGGEIFRATETMERVARVFGVQAFQAFVIANGIFACSASQNGAYSCKVRYLPLAPILLCRVEAANNLSRRIEGGGCGPREALEELGRIRRMTVAGAPAQIVAAGVGSACFCYLFGGGLADSLAALLAGFLLYAFQLLVLPRCSLSRMMSQIIGSAVVTLFSCAVFRLGLGGSLDNIIIGAIFPLVPGVPLTNAVRNFFENDYLAGVVRLTDAILSAGCIAAGVGLVMTVWRFLEGGALPW